MAQPPERRNTVPKPDRPVRLFISYSHKNDDGRARLDTHMAQLKRENVEVFFDGNILPGAELDPAILKKLKAADVFVALGSPDYIASPYCYEIEYGFALRKAGRKGIHVVVALLKSCQWRHTRMARYKLLPRDGKPVDQWARRGDAYENIVEGVRAVVRAIRGEWNRQIPLESMPARPGKTAPAAAKPRAKASTKDSRTSLPKKADAAVGKKRVSADVNATPRAPKVTGRRPTKGKSPPGK